MDHLEELIAVRAAPQQAMRVLLTPARMAAWVAPDVTITPRTARPVLAPGDRFRLELPGGFGFDYQVEAASDREVVLGFEGPWRGRERWSFIPDGADTVVRRAYEVEAGSPLRTAAWRTVGRLLVAAHYKIELARFRSAVERDPGVRGEIEPGAAAPAEGVPFPVDDG